MPQSTRMGQQLEKVLLCHVDFFWPPPFSGGWLDWKSFDPHWWLHARCISARQCLYQCHSRPMTEAMVKMDCEVGESPVKFGKNHHDSFQTFFAFFAIQDGSMSPTYCCKWLCGLFTGLTDHAADHCRRRDISFGLKHHCEIFGSEGRGETQHNVATYWRCCVLTSTLI